MEHQKITSGQSNGASLAELCWKIAAPPQPGDVSHSFKELYKLLAGYHGMRLQQSGGSSDARGNRSPDKQEGQATEESKKACTGRGQEVPRYVQDSS